MQQAIGLSVTLEMFRYHIDMHQTIVYEFPQNITKATTEFIVAGGRLMAAAADRKRKATSALTALFGLN